MSSNWIVCTEPRPDASTILVCFPYAGAGASLFWDWAAALADVEVLAVVPPGRGRRLQEPPLRRLADVVAALTPEVVSRLDRPFALFGHSVGAVVAFELARALRRRLEAPPTCLLVSASRAPHVRAPRQTYDLPEDELVADLVPEADPDDDRIARERLLALMLPTVRADLEVAQTYEHRLEQPLTCRIVAFCGAADRHVSREDVAGWREHTTGSFALHVFDGDHLFLRSHRAALLAVVARELSAAVGGFAADP